MPSKQTRIQIMKPCSTKEDWICTPVRQRYCLLQRSSLGRDRFRLRHLARRGISLLRELLCILNLLYLLANVKEIESGDLPALVIACLYRLSCTSPAAN